MRTDDGYGYLQVPEKLHGRIEALAKILNMGAGVLTAEVMEDYVNKIQKGIESARQIEHDTEER